MSGTLINIGGRTNSGRSTLTVTMAKNAILNGWMVAGNKSFRKAFPYPTLADVALDDEHVFNINLKLVIFDDTDRMDATLEPLIQQLLANGTHVVTVTHSPSDLPVVSIAGQHPDALLVKTLLGDDLTVSRWFFKSHLSPLAAASPDEAESILSNTSRPAGSTIST